MKYSELSVVPRFGYALITADEGRTAITQPIVSETEFRFVIVTWCATYEGALDMVATAADEIDEQQHLAIGQ